MSKRKIITTFILVIVFIQAAFGAVDRYSKEYLQNKKHFAIINPIVENTIERILINTLKKETGAKFKVHFTGYTTSSIKKGIFKSLELSANNPVIDNIPVSYVHIKTLTDYNYIDYKTNPIEFKSDITFAYDIVITDESINTALKGKKYQRIIENVNKLAYPIFSITSLKTKVSDGKLYLIIDYNFPIARITDDRTFVTASNLKIENGKIVATNVYVNKAHGNLGRDKVANLINLLNPLEFTMQILDTKKCHTKIENVNIVDNNIKVDGKIFIKE